LSEAPKEIRLTINEQPIVAKPGMTVFQAAQTAGIFIPHYCYHPDLSIAGVCRMCMCEIEKNPRLQISCNTTVAEGMVVRTDSAKVKETVQSVLELHLINHPLDCPICDKAGECKLQDYYKDYGLYKSRIEYDTKNHKPKVVDIGSIVLDDERCILCTRCVRFTAEVTKTNELGIFNRGDRSVLRTYDEKPLRNEYTGNLADICPVGALTAKEFRFKQRVWFLDRNDSICTQCARGCNVTVSVNPQTTKLYRVEPRRNPEVNQSWMCDTGRWNTHYVGDESRIKNVQSQKEGQVFEETWESYFKVTSQKIKNNPGRVLVGLSAQLTTEEMADILEEMTVLGVTHYTWVVDETTVEDRAAYDGILKHRDQTPNAAGFLQLMSTQKKPWLKQEEALKKLQAKEFDQLILLGLEGITMPGVAEFLLKTPKETEITVHATNRVSLFEKAAWVLPNTSSFEKSGTMVNALGMMQKLVASMPWQFMARDGHSVCFGLKQGNDRSVSPSGRFQTVFKRLSNEAVFPGARNDWRKMPASGVNIGVVGRAEGIKYAKR
jgi:NADH-quinone oxidoreductase subunit G